jgi:hypothetical protein
MCAYKRKSWQEKLNVNLQPQVKIADKDFAGIRTGQQMLIPTPRLVEDYIRQIPEGVPVTMETLRKDLALEHGADVTCPLTSGIFVRIVAEAAYEQYQQGTPLEQVAPFWRVIDEKSPTAKKLTFGKEFLLERRKAEGLGKRN